MQKFRLGRTLITPAALEVIQNAGQEAAFFLDRHVQGDWGQISKDDREANERDLRDGGRLLSAYKTLAGDKIYVLTEGDRSSTTILLPDEY